jgi:vacuolar protein sorting-associated protein 13A/C
MDYSCTDVALCLKEEQYHNITRLINLVHRYQRGIRAKHRDLRPSTSVQNDPKSWWNYVIVAVLREVKAKRNSWNWEFMVERARVKNDYMALWKKKAILSQKVDSEFS